MDDLFTIRNVFIDSTKTKYRKQYVINEENIDNFTEEEIKYIIQENNNTKIRDFKEDQEYEDEKFYQTNNLFLQSKVKPKFDNTWTIYDMVKIWSPIGWEEVFRSCIDDLRYISSVLEERNKNYGHFIPNKEDLFKAFELTPLKKIRVVIIAQDPYHNIYNDGVVCATGSAFSTTKGRKIQPSLGNIFKEIERTDSTFKMPNHGDLTSWQKQGVFLLNSCLTTEVGKPGAHSKYMIWNSFISKVLSAINSNNPKCIYLLWGKEALKIKEFLKGTNIILESGHPSPYSVKYFENNNHFKIVNDLLDPAKVSKLSKKDRNYIQEEFWGKINWNLD